MKLALDITRRLVKSGIPSRISGRAEKLPLSSAVSIYISVSQKEKKSILLLLLLLFKLMDTNYIYGRSDNLKYIMSRCSEVCIKEEWNVMVIKLLSSQIASYLGHFLRRISVSVSSKYRFMS